MQALATISQTPKQLDVCEVKDNKIRGNGREVQSISDLSPGQHIVAFRNLHYHHGIYVGHNEVIDFSREGVQKKSYYEFEDGCRVYAIDHDDEDLPSTDEILRRANSALKTYDKPYNVATNNCEHFATFITTNQRESQQVQRVAAGAGVAIAGAAVAAVGYAMYKPNKK